MSVKLLGGVDLDIRLRADQKTFEISIGAKFHRARWVVRRSQLAEIIDLGRAALAQPAPPLRPPVKLVEVPLPEGGADWLADAIAALPGSGRP